MRRICFLCAVLFYSLSVTWRADGNNVPRYLLDGFQNPPREAGVKVWWHWMNGNVTEEGIRKDLEWMHRSGIVGFQHFDVGSSGYPDMIPKRLGYMSDEWKNAIRYAVTLADSLGMEVAIASSPGWSANGGPWVKPENAMKKLVWSTVEVDGGDIDVPLPEPLKTIGLYQDARARKGESWYGDVAVVAVRVRENDLNPASLGGKCTSSGGKFDIGWLTDGHFLKSEVLPRAKDGSGWIQYEFEEPVTFTAVTLGTSAARVMFSHVPFSSHYRLETSDDGKEWKTVFDIPDCNVPSMTADFPPATARYFRLMMHGFGSSVKGRPISEFNLYTLPRVHHSEEKSGFASPFNLMDYPTPDDAAALDRGDIVVISDKVADGRVRWHSPQGRWRIYRFGATQTGSRNYPAASDATGWEVDKLDREALLDYYRYYYDTYKEATGGLIGSRGIQYMLNDSFEKKQTTWTAGLDREFSSRMGYDLLPWLPVLAGEIVGSALESEKFLFDWRSLIATLYRERCDDLQQIIDDYGMKGRYTESHENARVQVSDGMDYKRNASFPMSAFWINGDQMPEQVWAADIRESSSVAHFYGQNVAVAESFTVRGAGGMAYTGTPARLKLAADFALSNGLNGFIIHESAHQPSDSLVPGAGLLGYGQWFNRHETWADWAGLWTGYLARSSWMLRQGRAVADMLVYYGEDNNITGLYLESGPSVPEGYNYDFINRTGLLEDLRAESGLLKAPSGMTYRVLLLDRNCEIMSLDVLKRIKELADAGVYICGQVPLRAASLNDDDAEFASIVRDVWHSGRRNVTPGGAGEALGRCGVEKDFCCDNDDVRFVHRSLSDGTDIYWVCNFGKETEARMVMRSPNGYGAVMDPVTLTVRDIPVRTMGGKAAVDITMGAGDALFIVLTPEGSAPVAESVRRTLAASVEGPWTVRFQEGRGAPAKTEFNRLISFSESENERIRYFSGKAVYTASFKVKASDLKGSERIVLSLGEVHELASVKLNGKEVGGLWRKPFEIDITSAVKRGENRVEITVANLWVNRIIGDMQPGAKKKYTWTPKVFYQADSQLLPSGLLGPVTVWTEIRDNH